MAEKIKAKFSSRSTKITLILLLSILIGVTIAIPIIYSTGREPEAPNKNIENITEEYVTNECTQSKTNVTPIAYISNSEPFPYKLHSYIYRPSVISNEITLMFGFRHDNKSWALDKISFVDTTTQIDIIKDGDFESNFLHQSYSQCIVSNTRSSTSDILFDIPYSQDFYYNDQTVVGMTYLTQKIPVEGGKYYNISFYLENRGYKENYFVILVGY